jgi:sulfur carrier protein
VTLSVNGNVRQVPEGMTVASLLAELGVSPPGIAVAVNARVVRGADFASHALGEGDSVEIIRAVAGG